MSCGTRPCAADQVVVHVARVRGGVADPQEAIDLGKLEDQPGETPFGSARAPSP